MAKSYFGSNGSSSNGLAVDEGTLSLRDTSGVDHNITATAAEINSLAGITSTVAELNSVDLSAVGAIRKVKKIAISTTPTGAEQDTTFDLPTNCIVTDVWIQVTTAEATGTTKTLDVGLLSSESGGDADGFLDGVSVAATGLARGAGTFSTDHWASTTHGALLLEKFLAGTNSTNEGVLVRKPHLSTAVTARSITFTAGSNNFAEFRGALYIEYIELG